MNTAKKAAFASDYEKGAHPLILERLLSINKTAFSGYGTDAVSESAREKIREACACPGAAVYFLTGGTQTNALMIDAFLRPWQGVIAPDSGHISVHEAGAVEGNGHKVLTIPQESGKITAEALLSYLKTFYGDENHEHMVAPGMVYLSHPTEFGTLYSLAELRAIRKICDTHSLSLCLDGARLAYALACPENDISLPDLAALCDAFYIGGTKCGALFGEALVLPDPGKVPGIFPLIKRHGALLAKGWLAGAQFDTLFSDGLYEKIGARAQKVADKIREGLKNAGYPLLYGSPTNQVFTLMEDEKLAALGEKVTYSFWEKADADHTVIRLAASWYTEDEDVEILLSSL